MKTIKWHCDCYRWDKFFKNGWRDPSHYEHDIPECDCTFETEHDEEELEDLKEYPISVRCPECGSALDSFSHDPIIEKQNDNT